jgi:hypothetical protein
MMLRLLTSAPFQRLNQPQGKRINNPIAYLLLNSIAANRCLPDEVGDQFTRSL